MIRFVDIQNFQSHENTRLEFVDGVNVLVGLSDAGKSAVLRAMRWVCQGRPIGEATVRSHWGGETSVVIGFDDGNVERVRGGKKDRSNAYLIDDGKKKLALKASGKSVPSEVLNLADIPSISWQHQLDRPFLIGESISAGEVARILNEVASLDLIDQSLAFMDSKMRENKKEITSLKSREEALLEEREQFSDTDAATKAVEKLSRLDREIAALSDDADALEALIESVAELEERLEEIGDVDDAAKTIKTLEALAGEIDGTDQSFRALQSHVFSIDALEEKMFTATENERDAEREFHRERPESCPLCGKEWK